MDVQPYERAGALAAPKTIRMKTKSAFALIELLVVEKVKQAIGLGSARVPRAVFGVPSKTSFLKLFSAFRNCQLHEIRARRPNRHAGRMRSPFPNPTPPENPR